MIPVSRTRKNLDYILNKTNLQIADFEKRARDFKKQDDIRDDKLLRFEGLKEYSLLNKFRSWG